MKINIQLRQHTYDLLGRKMLSDAEVASVTRCYVRKSESKEGEVYAYVYINFSWVENGVIKEAYLRERVGKNGELQPGCKLDPSFLDQYEMGVTDVDPANFCMEVRKHLETGVIYKRAIFLNRAQVLAQIAKLAQAK